MSIAKRKQNETAKTVPAQSQPKAAIPEQQIAERAYALYLARGAGDGHALDDWLQAEQELRQSSTAA